MDRIKKLTKVSKYTALKFAAIFLVVGVLLGVFSKFLDTTASNELPRIFQVLDITNFLGRFAVWIFIAVVISVYTKSPYRAAVYVFLFFAGMIASYYLYSFYVAGFFPQRYAMVWITFTLISPLLAFIVWFAKGRGPIAVLISAAIIAFMINFAFYYGMFYISLSHVLELLLLIAAVFILKRGGNEMVYTALLALLLAIVFRWLSAEISPYQFW